MTEAGDAQGSAEPSPPTCIDVYLLDDHELVRRGLRDLLSAEPDIRVVGESGSAASAVEHPAHPTARGGARRAPPGRVGHRGVP